MEFFITIFKIFFMNFFQLIKNIKYDLINGKILNNILFYIYIYIYLIFKIFF